LYHLTVLAVPIIKIVRPGNWLVVIIEHTATSSSHNAKHDISSHKVRVQSYVSGIRLQLITAISHPLDAHRLRSLTLMRCNEQAADTLQFSPSELKTSSFLPFGNLVTNKTTSSSFLAQVQQLCLRGVQVNWPSLPSLIPPKGLKELEISYIIPLRRSPADSPNSQQQSRPRQLLHHAIRHGHDPQTQAYNEQRAVLLNSLVGGPEYDQRSQECNTVIGRCHQVAQGILTFA